MSRRRTCYYYDSELGNYFYGAGHPMKPHRIRMAHHLLMNYGLLKKLDVLKPAKATDMDMTRFHSDEYINFLKHISPDNVDEYMKQLLRFNVGEDSPVFDGIYDYCQVSAGGSLAAATKLNHGMYDIAINWAGGLHHAKKSEASGFCYVNDIVLGILELLKYHQRVLYIDIDIHHGDGVEEAFFTTNRVMTCSFHKFGDCFFPGTGHVRDVGAGPGKGYSLNFPLKDGMDDLAYRTIFRPTMQRVMEWFRPGVVVIQCGADSLYGDRLGCFNLTIQGHADCVEFMKSFNVPLMVLGGGGYTITNVSRCWAYETSVCLEMVVNDYYEYYAPEFRLFFPPSNMPNLNSPAYLSHIMAAHFETMREAEPAPSVQMHDVPPDLLVDSDEDEDGPFKYDERPITYGNEADANESDDEAPNARMKGRAWHSASAPARAPPVSAPVSAPAVTPVESAAAPAPQATEAPEAEEEEDEEDNEDEDEDEMDVAPGEHGGDDDDADDEIVVDVGGAK